ncbi:MAG: Maf family protein, partial [Actinomycetes bacterium]
MTPRPTIILASASPARRALLRAAGVSVEVRVSDVDENAVEETLGPVSPGTLALALAEAKAQNVAAQLNVASALDPILVVGADTILDLDGVALGRPKDAADAMRRWYE